MGCCFGIVGLAMPRLALFIVWISTNWVARAIDVWAVALLGFLFLPYTTLAYVLLYHWSAGVSGFEFFLVALAFIVDLGALVGGGYTNRHYVPGSSGSSL